MSYFFDDDDFNEEKSASPEEEFEWIWPDIEMPLEEIRHHEYETYIAFGNFINHIRPKIDLRKIVQDKNEKRTAYGLGGLIGTGHVEGYHFLRFKIFSGMENGIEVDNVVITPIDSEDFIGNYDQAMDELQDIDDELDRQVYIASRKDGHHALHQFIDNCNSLFAAVIKKHGAPQRQRDSFEKTVYDRHGKTGQNYLDEMPGAVAPALILDFMQNEEEQLKSVNALTEIVSQLDLLQDEYAQLKYTYGIENKYSLEN